MGHHARSQPRPRPRAKASLGEETPPQAKAVPRVVPKAVPKAVPKVVPKAVQKGAPKALPGEKGPVANTTHPSGLIGNPMHGKPEPPTVISVNEAQKYWNNTCAQDKCYRQHDGRGWERTDSKPCLFCESCTEHLVSKGWKGLWCKDNNQRSAFGRLTQKGGVRERPTKAHTANSAYTVLQDDSRPQPVAQGTWIQDRDAQGGWRFEVGEVRQVVQAEATENDPYARAYLAQPNQYTILDDSPTGPLTPPLSPYRVLQDNSVVVPDMAGDGTMDYDSDDYSP